VLIRLLIPLALAAAVIVSAATTAHHREQQRQPTRSLEIHR
jgi:predicted aconitase